MKNTLRCPKCAHNHILYVSQVADTMGGGTHGGVAPWKLVMVPRSPGSKYAHTYGELEAGVCRACGYTEFYIKDPASIPVDGYNVREVVGPEAQR